MVAPGEAREHLFPSKHRTCSMQARVREYGFITTTLQRLLKHRKCSPLTLQCCYSPILFAAASGSLKPRARSPSSKEVTSLEKLALTRPKTSKEHGALSYRARDSSSEAFSREPHILRARSDVRAMSRKPPPPRPVPRKPGRHREISYCHGSNWSPMCLPHNDSGVYENFYF